MVYCGKPSRGCQNCKTRRIKCDEARPACGQCRKSNRVCPGYPDEFDLIFRNETSATKRRAERAFSAASSSSRRSKSSSKGTKLRKSASPAEATLSWDTTTSTTTDNSPRSDDTEELSPASLPSAEVVPTRSYQWTYESPSDLDAFSELELDDDGIIQLPDLGDIDPPDLTGFDPWYSPPVALALSRETNATTFFFKNYALTPRQQDSMRGYVEILVPMYQNTPENSVLHYATHATALAALSNSHKALELRMEAHRLYGKALRAVGPLIKDPVMARSDELLMSILLFSLYEAITATKDSLTLWTHHISGAVALVKLRGEEQLKNPQSLHLFRAVRASMLTSSIVQGRTIQEFPGEKGWKCDEDMDINAANRLTLICLKLPDIKCYAQTLLARKKTLKTVSEMMDLIRTGKDIDSQLENWALTLPPEWAYKAVEICKDEPQTDDELERARFWPGPIHIYQDLSVANVWNDYRVSRIFCQAVILGCIAALPEPARNEQLERISSQAVHITQEMVNDFCSGLPFMLGYDAKQRTKGTGQDEGSFRAMGGYFAAWPLFVTKKIPCIPGRQKKWLEGRLFFIGKTFGLNEEQVLSFAKRHVLTSGPSFGYSTKAS